MPFVFWQPATFLYWSVWSQRESLALPSGLVSPEAWHKSSRAHNYGACVIIFCIWTGRWWPALNWSPSVRERYRQERRMSGRRVGVVGWSGEEGWWKKKLTRTREIQSRKELNVSWTISIANGSELLMSKIAKRITKRACAETWRAAKWEPISSQSTQAPQVIEHEIIIPSLTNTAL